MANVNKLIGLFDLSSAAPKVVKEVAQEIPVSKTVKNGDKLLSAELDTTSTQGKAFINMSHNPYCDMSKIDDSMKVADDLISDTQKRIDEDDFLDTTNPLTQMNSFNTGYEPCTVKGTYGQDIFDPLDSMNKMDALSPFYNPDENF